MGKNRSHNKLCFPVVPSLNKTYFSTGTYTVLFCNELTQAMSLHSTMAMSLRNAYAWYELAFHNTVPSKT